MRPRARHGRTLKQSAPRTLPRHCIIRVLQKPLNGTGEAQAIEFEGLKTSKIQA